MKLCRWFQWTNPMRYGSYVKVTRPDSSYKIINKPTDETISLAKALHLKIKANGPITIADYMKSCLTNPSVGYYMQKDIIGQKGDFITSPEITQLFGEIIAVWIHHELKKIGFPKPWQIVELGPGKGSLIKDVLRTLIALKGIDDLSVHLVEISPHLACVQSHALCTDNFDMGMIKPKDDGMPFYKSIKTFEEIPVFWYEKLDQVPRNFSVILAHEFFDALPIHKFQKVEDGWREILINSVPEEDGSYKFEYVLSDKLNSPSMMLIREDEVRDHLEISLQSGALAGEIAQRLEEFGGFSLFIDYGHDGEKTDTFRAFKKHQVMDPLVNPGTCDLTADVDFSFLKSIMKDKMLVFGPVNQGDFLQRMGIQLRLETLLQNASEDVAKNLKSACRMIVDGDQMGNRYKFFAAFPLVLKEHLEKYPVAGFH